MSHPCRLGKCVVDHGTYRSFEVFVDDEVAAPVPASESVDLLGNERTRAIWIGDENERKENVNGGCVVKAWRVEAEGVQREALKVLKTKTKKSSGKRIRMGAEAEGKVSIRFTFNSAGLTSPIYRSGRQGCARARTRGLRPVSRANAARAHAYLIRAWYEHFFS